MRWANNATIVVALVLIVGIVAYNYCDVMWMSDLGSHSDMRLIGEGIYEYHAKTGKWPSKLDDLSETSLPLKYPQWWTDQLALDANAIVCPKNLKPDPKDNRHVILCYHCKGLDAERGRMWVCWGDLRTGPISLEELKEHLNKQKIVEIPVPEKNWSHSGGFGGPSKFVQLGQHLGAGAFTGFGLLFRHTAQW